MLKFVRIHPLTVPVFILFLLLDKSFLYHRLYLFILLHELSHLSVALLLRQKCNGLYLLPWGCMLSVGTLLSKKSSVIIFLAGPIFNLFLFFFKISPKENLALALFNLIPVMPLDGGMIINLLFPRTSSYISIIFIFLSFVFCLVNRVFPLLPIILFLVFAISEKTKIDKTICDKIIRHFSQK